MVEIGLGEVVEEGGGVGEGKGREEGGLGPAFCFGKHVAGGAAAVVADAGEPEGLLVAGVGFPVGGVLSHFDGVDVGADRRQG